MSFDAQGGTVTRCCKRISTIARRGRRYLTWDRKRWKPLSMLLPELEAANSLPLRYTK